MPGDGEEKSDTAHDHMTNGTARLPKCSTNGVRTRKMRIFKPGESLITSSTVASDTFARGLFNYAMVHSLLALIALVLRDSYGAGRLYLNVFSLQHVFGGPWEWLAVAAIECLQLGVAFLIHPCFMLWVRSYQRVGRPSSYLFLLLYSSYVIISFYSIFSAVFHLQLHAAGRIICCIEQLRLAIKSFSFIYENAYKVLYPWNKDDETGPAVWYGGQMSPQIGSFSSYLYFLFCPVAVYRDHYPRQPRNIAKAFFYFLQFVATNLLAYAAFRDLIYPESLRLEDIVASFLFATLLGFILLFLAHASFLHAWLNMAAELTGFADRDFYQDWWNAQDLGEYLRKWNPVIQEWFKDYVYHHLRRHTHPTVAILLVLLISAVVHDLLIGCGVGFFIPLYILEYSIGAGILLRFKPSLGRWVDQVVMGLLLGMGSALQITFYNVELASRSYCPVPNPGRYDMVTLRMFECYRQFNTY